MRQLKGKPKESGREKKQRKKDFAKTKQQVYTVAVPALIAIFLFVAAYVYLKTRPRDYVA